jgi:hypothetical protein
MVIDRTHIKWGAATAIASGVVGVLYLANNSPETLLHANLSVPLPAFLGPVPPLGGNFGATPLGLIYGTLALIIFLFAAMLGARRNQKWLPIGRIQMWLKAHIWLTIFTIPLVVCHCGFHGGGPMTQFLLWLYGFVMLSGFWGLALQHVVPKLMQEFLPEEVIFEQIPYIRTQLAAAAAKIRAEVHSEIKEAAPPVEMGVEAGHSIHAEHRVHEQTVLEEHAVATSTKKSGHPGAIKAVLRFIDKEAVPYLQVGGPRRRSSLSARASSDNQFRILHLQAPDNIQVLLDQLQEACDEKRRLDLQSRLHYWLHGWLLVHAPASLFLVVLTIVHAVVAAYLYA